MLTCITCKQKIEDDGGEEGPRARPTPHNKDSIKSLTTQVLFPLLYFYFIIYIFTFYDTENIKYIHNLIQ